MNELLKTQARRRGIPSVRYAGFAVLPTVQRPHKGTADTAAQEEPREEKEVTIIVLCVMQKTAGQRKDRPKDIPWENWERVKVTIVCEAMALVLSGEYEPKEESKSERKTAG